jgi:phosphatidate cytidylyltransferase
MNKMPDLLRRTVVTIIIVPLALLLIYYGGYLYQAVIILLLCLSAWEYDSLLRKVNLNPALYLAIIGVLILSLGRSLFQFANSSALLVLLLFLISAWHILSHEKGAPNPGVDFGGSVSILIYIGFLGSYLISLRALPNGMWWTFLVLPTVWIADSGAYFLGKLIGKYKLAPRTSPHKTWEGYFGSLIFGSLGSLGLLLLYERVFNAGLSISPLQGALLGLAISAFIPLGDLTESMIKRQAGEKDSGNIFPGHGGFFDRLDSLFWAAPIGYYLILHLFI